MMNAVTAENETRIAVQYKLLRIAMEGVVHPNAKRTEKQISLRQPIFDDNCMQ